MRLGRGVLHRPPIVGMLACSRGQIMLKDAGISSLNPKALLVHFSPFPQFIDPAVGRPVAARTGRLGTLHMTACALVYLAVDVLTRSVLNTRPAAGLSPASPVP